MLSEKVLQSLTQDVQKNKFYAVIMDGTQDNAGKEQQSVCIRYTTTNLEVEEVVVGLHEPADTTCQSLSNMELNVIVQRRSMSVCGMVEAVNIINARLETLRSSEEFETLFNETKKSNR